MLFGNIMRGDGEEVRGELLKSSFAILFHLRMNTIKKIRNSKGEMFSFVPLSSPSFNISK